MRLSPLLTTFTSCPYRYALATSFTVTQTPFINGKRFNPLNATSGMRLTWPETQRAFKSAQATNIVSPTAGKEAANNIKAPDTLDLSFEDAEAAFKSKTTWELIRAYTVFKLCSVGYLVDNNMKVGMKLCRHIFIIAT